MADAGRGRPHCPFSSQTPTQFKHAQDTSPLESLKDKKAKLLRSIHPAPPTADAPWVESASPAQGSASLRSHLLGFHFGGLRPFFLLILFKSLPRTLLQPVIICPHRKGKNGTRAKTFKLSANCSLAVPSSLLPCQQSGRPVGLSPAEVTSLDREAVTGNVRPSGPALHRGRGR